MLGYLRLGKVSLMKKPLNIYHNNLNQFILDERENFIDYFPPTKIVVNETWNELNAQNLQIITSFKQALNKKVYSLKYSTISLKIEISG
jgi:hypothetical protein